MHCWRDCAWVRVGCVAAEATGAAVRGALGGGGGADVSKGGGVFVLCVWAWVCACVGLCAVRVVDCVCGVCVCVRVRASGVVNSLHRRRSFPSRVLFA